MASNGSSLPEWVTAELFVDLLKDTVKGFSKIKSFKANSGSVAGENYASIMLRIKIDVELEDGKEKTVSYMLKLAHKSEAHTEVFQQYNMFETERNMYNTIVPEMEQLYRDVGAEVKFGPTSYELKGVKTEYVLLEDLSPQGFKNMNRLEGLDQVHTESALRKLAQWHAASVARVATKGPYPESYSVGFFMESSRPLVTQTNKGLQQSFLNCCEKYENSAEYIEQVRKVVPTVTDQFFKLAKLDSSGFNVLNHGDFWSNNMMFSHDAFGKLKNTYLIDFQLPKYGNAAQDLYYFLFSSTKLEDKLNKFDHYIKTYHDSLVENLKLLQYAKPMPTLRELHVSLIKNGFYGYMSATGVMSGVLLEPTDNVSFEDFVGDSADGNDFKTKLFSNSRYKEHIKLILPWLVNRGALEVD